MLDFLTLERAERDLFHGWCHAGLPRRAFGGQVAAQALTAAGGTVEDDRRVHSLHGYFLRGGNPARPIAYRVERLTDGRGYASRRVTARQGDEVIFTLSASFTRPEEIPGRQLSMPPTTPPEDLPNAFRAWAARDPEGFGQFEIGRVLDVRRAPETWPDRAGGTEQRLWIRSAAPLPDGPLVHMCALTYASDLMLAPVAALDVEAPGVLSAGPDTSRHFLASLDHAVWFHRPFRADEWLLVVQRGPTAGDGRGLVHGEFWSRDGRLVASVVQETVLRPRRSP
ncbi:acyl-CoA thioesterase II [Streptomyces qinzhouensis]|uniref:Acyl-CoA thioesterase II n=1 Tax=Streptomyces qinzhouensis TaxID=2599401 RepID=A0A5B8JHI2_9ACTN|nr:acyl-CoA thioesterase II [Streptomyces qinzhouensis]